jgi:hypothetical protein
MRGSALVELGTFRNIGIGTRLHVDDGECDKSLACVPRFPKVDSLTKQYGQNSLCALPWLIHRTHYGRATFK